MDSAVVDSDASLDSARPRARHSNRSVTGTAGANGSAGTLSIPRPELLPLPPVEVPYEHALGMAGRAAKRSFDLIGALLLLLILAPAWLFIALAIKFDSTGPVLFRQRRIGRDGRPFRMFKFRTMVDGADEQKTALLHLNEAAEGLFKINADPRITSVGAWLRAICLDELPQLLNVITGQMSLVGPRPLVPEEDELITGEDRRRLAMRPGMTGVWQVGGASLIPIREMVRLDRGYLEDWSLWLDVKLLLLTARYVILRKGV
jgi:lipopolysaccharide/colanic/teichoic acid biosynthesis glycosyltransferase